MWVEDIMLMKNDVVVIELFLSQAFTTDPKSLRNDDCLRKAAAFPEAIWSDRGINRFHSYQGSYEPPPPGNSL